MSGKNKNYNSIIFFTTLSVYLGLVLVGGSPQALAYAATTRNFDIQREIEFKDDLDNKPDESCADLKSKTAELDNQFVEDYFDIVFSPSVLKINYPSGMDRSLISGHVQLGFDKTKILSFVEGFDGFADYRYEKTGVSGKIRITPKNADSIITPIISRYDASLKFQRCKFQSLPQKAIYENTKVTFENNQIFIVTNLPRASIDPLIK